MADVQAGWSFKARLLRDVKCTVYLYIELNNEGDGKQNCRITAKLAAYLREDLLFSDDYRLIKLTLAAKSSISGAYDRFSAFRSFALLQRRRAGEGVLPDLARHSLL